MQGHSKWCLLSFSEESEQFLGQQCSSTPLTPAGQRTEEEVE